MEIIGEQERASYYHRCHETRGVQRALLRNGVTKGGATLRAGPERRGSGGGGGGTRRKVGSKATKGMANGGGGNTDQ